jgi:hypothetical protein
MAFLEQHMRKVADLIGYHAPSAIIAILIAELFFKFHSFTLEVIAFLTTWYVVDLIIAVPYRALRSRVAGAERDSRNGR